MKEHRENYIRGRIGNNWDTILEARQPAMPRWKLVMICLIIAACFLAVMWVEEVPAAEPVRSVSEMMLVLPCQTCEGSTYKVMDTLEDTWIIVAESEGEHATASPGTFIMVCQDLSALDRNEAGEPVYITERTYRCKNQ